ncbi:MAG: MoxR family ATPase [Nocardioidaceae bacterium]
MVIATQNPIEQAGTYRLPEAQLDRFLMKSSVGYPDAQATEDLLQDAKTRDRAGLIKPIMSTDLIESMSAIADEVYVDPAIITYVRELAEASRDADHVKLGLSVRGCLALIRVCKTWAVANGRSYVVPQDVADLAHPVLGHRLILDGEAVFRGVDIDEVIDGLLKQIAAPPYASSSRMGDIEFSFDAFKRLVTPLGRSLLLIGLLAWLLAVFGGGRSCESRQSPV